MNPIKPGLRSLSASAPTARRLLPCIVSCGILSLFAGCATETESHLVSAPPPPTPTKAVTTTTTTSTPAAVAVTNDGYTTTRTSTPAMNTVVVTQSPPALQQEVVLAQPSPQHVWLAGYWTWRNDRYEWMAGRWVLPPNSTATWVGPRWEKQGNAFRFYEGYWN